MDREWLWFKVLAACYDEERGHSKFGGRDGFPWLREVERIHYGM